jgi:choline dehydrogenase-like flavoprotein
MLIDANEVEDGALVRTDLCVIGAGAAGITLARALAGPELDVVLVESGGLTREAESDALQEAVNLDARYPIAASRSRVFGGSTSHWGGLCLPLDADDFRPHSWVADSGWPLQRADLEPYYAQALPIIDLPRIYRAADVRVDEEMHPPLLGAADAAFVPLVWLKSPPTRMGTKYRDEVTRSDHLRCYVHATASELIPSRYGNRIERLEVRTLGGRGVRVVARDYVLAAGGIENARLLLLSDSVLDRGIGNQHDLVGRCFMDHLNQVVGAMTLVSSGGSTSFQEEHVMERRLHGVDASQFGFATTAALRAEHRLLACSLNAVPSQEPDPSAAAVEDLLAGPGGGASEGVRTGRRYVLYTVAEQTPNRESRVFLRPERDPLGLRKVAVDLRITPADTRSVRRSLELFGSALARTGHGRVRIRDVDDAAWHVLAGHHMGTTRMADDPGRGVTDRDGKVHGVANLHVAGSSLFPTGGFANPTLTIVALALRQAARLRAGAPRAPELRGGGPETTNRPGGTN